MNPALPKIRDLVTDTSVAFCFYRRGELWYHVVPNLVLIPGVSELKTPFLFPVPIEDTGDGTFRATDRGIFFMRYIRKHLEALKKEREVYT